MGRCAIIAFIGEKVAAVAAENPDAAAEGARLVEVEYEELPMVTDPLAAMEGGAQLMHQSYIEPHVSTVAVVCNTGVVEDGRIINGHFGDYKIPTMPDIPRLITINVPSGGGNGPLDVKGMASCRTFRSRAPSRTRWQMRSELRLRSSQ